MRNKTKWRIFPLNIDGTISHCRSKTLHDVEWTRKVLV